jgi:RNA polymerase sigma factor (sigma-70 family)
MASNHASEALAQLRRAGLLREAEGHTDAELLERFVLRRDPTALEALVRRHAPLVWGVCRRALPNLHDAEDAFQATFLVFVRRAASIRFRDLLAGWLHGVARQTARKARQTAAKRRAREKPMTGLPEPQAREREEGIASDLRPILDGELSRLPERYRVVVVLCDLEGKSRKEAAHHLGLPEGTVGSRLARARALLAKRLARHGLAVTGGALAALSGQAAPAALTSATLEAVLLFAAGKPAAALVSANVTSLTEGVLKAMFLTKLKASALAVAIVGLSLVGGLFAHRLLAAQPGPTEQQAPEVRGEAPEGPPPRRTGNAPPAPPEKLPTEGRREDAFPPRAAVKAEKEDRPAARGPLRVTIELRKDRARARQPFQVRVSVVNVSQSPQSFRVANGSWEMHWKISNDRVHWVPRAVFRNFIETVELRPGQACTKTGSLFVVPGAGQKELTFKMGFTPDGSKQTNWSNEVTLSLEPG